MALIDGLLHYYPGHEAAGQLLDAHGALDMDAGGAPGTAAGPITLARTYDRAVPDYHVAAAQWWSSGTAATVSLWTWVDALPTEEPALLLVQRAAGFHQAIVYYDPEFNWTCYWAEIDTIVVSGAHPTTDTWYHLVFRLGSDGSRSIWINGELRGASAGTPYDFSAHASDPVAQVGAYLGDTLGWPGRIAEIGMWDRAISDSEVADLYNAGAGLAYPFSGPPPRPPLIVTLTPQPGVSMIVTGYTALARMVAALDAALALDDATVHLFSADIVLTPNTVIADLTEADYTGYAAVTVTPPGVVYLAAAGDILWQFPQIAFQPTGTAVPNLIYGWWMDGEVLGTGDRLIVAQRFPEPVTMNDPLDVLFVHPRIPLGQGVGEYFP